ncbi:MAG: hypothetical protein HZA94_01430 [Candidatus Vogelbacteria bacterium]|nr:hypothetical protein [Candidatus Vogelbacteria bacterium]
MAREKFPRIDRPEPVDGHIVTCADRSNTEEDARIREKLKRALKIAKEVLEGEDLNGTGGFEPAHVVVLATAILSKME